jgi:hypothetical protein
MSNLYVSCPNILASQYAQVKLRDTFGFQILTGKEQNPHFSDRFVIVSPPSEYPNDKPVICYSPPTYDYDMHETWEKNHNWIDLFSALKLIALTEHGI